ncbi:exonuclease [Bacillus salacetis]|uniref:Exonuclease n=1 Tax=Bacillus salacetis TaxID=2315464 RepID=A0A3A1R5N6_9BACI|nr:3'-5' exonuclease [Bacillus salacetis]RIW37426.1 exonuclease [Bacillus salacetis]
MAELKQFIFFDFEMKCDDRGMAFEDMEAIRLGAVKYDLDTKQISYFDKYINPTTPWPLSNFCKQLTGISDRDLKTADSFPAVFKEFLFWIGGVKKSRFFSWSKSDMTRLKLDSERHGLHEVTIEKIESRYVDFQETFSKHVSKDNLSVANALGLYGVEFKGAAHNPMYDAFNTLQIFLHYYSQPLISDIEMAKAFILPGEEVDPDNINAKISQALIKDFTLLAENLHFAFRLRDAKKLLKKAGKTVKKYENILINRSGVFTEDVQRLVEHLVTFHVNLRESYQEHYAYSSRVMIMDDHSMNSIKHLK